MVLELSDGKVTVLLETEGTRPSRPPSKSEVTFNKYGDTYVLREIWDAEAQSGAVMVSSRAEKRHEKANGKATQQGVPATKSPKGKK
jgi:hypothetical protein